MRKVVAIVLICLMKGLPAFSQVTISLDSLAPPRKPFVPEWAFGINGGATLSKISFNPSVQQEMLMQYTGGITARYISEKNIGLQVELNYSLRGWKERTESVNVYSNFSPVPAPSDSSMHYTNYCRSLAYLELPIMTHIYFNMGKRARVMFLLGPQISYFLNEKTINSEIIVSIPETTRPYYNKEVERVFDYGLLGGMGFELRTGIGSFIVDGRYYFGLSDIFSNHKEDYFQSSSNQVISIKCAYLFRK